MIRTIIKVHIDELNDMIEESRAFNLRKLNSQEPYIFANESTLKQIAKQCGVDYEEEKDNNEMMMYHGCFIFKHNGLKDGQVEVR